jgi:hypothetical protein
LAAPIHPYVEQFDGSETAHGSLVEPFALAVDSHGDVYSSDREGARAINIFTPAGVYLTDILPGSSVAKSLAIDSEGDVFALVGSGVTEFVPSAYPVTSATTYTSKSISGPSGLGLTVDTSDNHLFVAEETKVGEYDPTGTLVRTYGVGTLEGAERVAVDESSGNLYVLDPAAASGPAVDIFDSSGALIGSFDGTGSPLGAFVDPISIAFDQSLQRLLVLDFRGEANPEPGGGHEGVVGEFDADGNFLAMSVNASQTPQESFELNQPGGSQNSQIAIDNSSGASAGRVYVAAMRALGYSQGAGEAPHGLIDAFGPIVDAPDVVTVAASAVHTTSAILNGTVDPNGRELESCTFEYGETKAYGHTTPCTSVDGQPISGAGEIPADSAVHVVSVGLSGLAVGHAYHFRLVTRINLGTSIATSRGEDLQFSTPGPGISGESASHVLDASARLEGIVDPNGEETHYVFQYVSEAAHTASGFAQATSVPIGGDQIEPGGAPMAVSQEVTGLNSTSTYYYRILATSECEAGVQCTAEGESDEASGGAESPHRFTTYAAPQSFGGCPNEALRGGASAALPDCRAYEQATPVDKNAVNAGGARRSLQTSVDGGRSTFFAEASMPGAEGAQDTSLFLASRNDDGSGWSSQGLFPPASFAPEATVLGLTEDLSHAYVVSNQFSAPGTLYQRSSADHSLRAIATVGRAEFAAATVNGSRMIFEAEKNASFKASEHAPASGPSVYLWDEASGTVALASVLNTGQAPPEGAFAGPYDWGQPSLDAGGAAQAYNTVMQHALSANGESLFFTAAGSGRLYLRRNMLQPQSPRNGQGKCTDPAKACTIEISASKRPVPDPDGLEPAAFMEATSDGSVAFFTSPSELTQDATTGPADQGNDLYRYDAASEELTDLAPDQADPDGAEVLGVLGSSVDGSSVYFVANGVLAANEGAGGSHASLGDCAQPEAQTPPKGLCNAYLWTAGSGGGGGQIKFIARLDASADSTAWRPSKSANSSADGAKAAAVSSDGDILLLRSKEKLTPYDNEGVSQLYRYRSGAGKMDCVSCNPTGAPPRGAALLGSLTTLGGVGGPVFPVVPRNLSRSGDRVFFETPDALVAADTNGAGGCPLVNGRQSCLDVYEWEAAGAGSCEGEVQDGGCLYLLSGGNTSDPSYFGGASASGDDVSIFTAQPLVNQDKDQLVDVYDVRVGGGIAAQNPVPPVACEGEACKEGGSGPALAPSPGSATFSGPGNPKSPRHHKKKHHQKKHKKKHHQKAKKHGPRGAHR